MYTHIYGHQRPSPYSHLCQSSNLQQYGMGTHITLPYKPYYTVMVRSPSGAEFQLILKTKEVPKGARGEAVCSVIDLKVYLIRLFYVSQF